MKTVLVFCVLSTLLMCAQARPADPATDAAAAATGAANQATAAPAAAATQATTAAQAAGQPAGAPSNPFAAMNPIKPWVDAGKKLVDEGIKAGTQFFNGFGR